jgi:hypothetical protein
MLIKIVDRFTSEGKKFYEFHLNDGPDGIEEVHGYATDLITSFTKILEWRERIASDYNQVTNDETLS